jgi:hypothetical protein
MAGGLISPPACERYWRLPVPNPGGTAIFLGFSCQLPRSIRIEELMCNQGCLVAEAVRAGGQIGGRQPV